MTGREFLHLAARRIYDTAPPEQKERDTASFEARALLLHFSDLSRESLPLRADEVLPAEIEKSLLSAMEEKCAGRPLQYILGEWEFYGLPMACGEGCLIPRPETELLTEYVQKNLPQNGRFLDLCTGSGCIPTALLATRPDLCAAAIDLSKDALFYAEKNRDRYNLCDRLTLVCADVRTFSPEGLFDAVVSNPPYIRSEDMKKLSREVLREPHMALDGGEDGLFFYRVIVRRFQSALRPDGFFAFEAGEDTTAGVRDILESEGFAAEMIPDYSGIMRVVAGRRKEKA